MTSSRIWRPNIGDVTCFQVAYFFLVHPGRPVSRRVICRRLPRHSEECDVNVKLRYDTPKAISHRCLEQCRHLVNGERRDRRDGVFTPDDTLRVVGQLQDPELHCC